MVPQCIEVSRENTVKVASACNRKLKYMLKRCMFKDMIRRSLQGIKEAGPV